MLEMKKLIATLYYTFDVSYLDALLFVSVFANWLTQTQLHLVDPKHEWSYRNAWFVYQSDMPMTITRRKLKLNTKDVDGMKYSRASKEST